MLNSQKGSARKTLVDCFTDVGSGLTKEPKELLTVWLLGQGLDTSWLRLMPFSPNVDLQLD